MLEEYSVLVVDSETSSSLALWQGLASSRRQVTAVSGPQKALEAYLSRRFDVVLLAADFPQEYSSMLLSRMKQLHPDVRILLMANQDASVQRDHQDINREIITKPFSFSKIARLADMAFTKVLQAKKEPAQRFVATGLKQEFIGETARVQHIRFLIAKVAPTDVPVLITGESGTGKDVIASEIHKQSKRATRPFIVKNCASLQKELARNELFGHERGAFTGAIASSHGIITSAHKGTLFLDEVGELPPEIQSQLLRFIETSQYRPVGGQEERQADVRLLFATNRDLAHEVAEGRFNEALYHRINVFHIFLPPLRERSSDILPLTQHFLNSMAQTRHRLGPGVLQSLQRYSWPGNVRELRNTIERGIVLAEKDVIDIVSLPQSISGIASAFSDPSFQAGRAGLGGPPASADESLMISHSSGIPGDGYEEHDPSSSNLSMHTSEARPCTADGTQPLCTRCHAGSLVLDCVEREHIMHVLEMFGGNKTKTAKALGIARKSLYRKLQRLEIETPD